MRVPRKVEFAMGTVALVLGISATAVSTYTQLHAARQVSCQSAINQEFLDTLKARASIGNENTQNLNNLVVTFIRSPGLTPGEKKAAIDTYLKELAKINAELAEATYPNLTSC